MIKFDIADIKSYKNFLAFVVIVAGLYNLGYWSTFKINILSYLDIAGLISFFIFPFLFTVGIFLIGLLFTDFFSLSLYKIFPYGGYQNKKSKGYKVTSTIVYTILTAMMVFIVLFVGIEAWLIVSIFGWSIYSVFIINYLIKLNIIAHEKFTIHFVQLSILVLILSFSVGKYNSLRIKNNYEFEYIMFQQNENDKEIRKLIGKAGKHYFVSPLNNSSKIVIAEDKIESLEIFEFKRRDIKTATDSLINKIIYESD